jgi:hypothetical protein
MDSRDLKEARQRRQDRDDLAMEERGHDNGRLPRFIKDPDDLRTRQGRDRARGDETFRRAADGTKAQLSEQPFSARSPLPAGSRSAPGTARTSTSARVLSGRSAMRFCALFGSSDRQRLKTVSRIARKRDRKTCFRCFTAAAGHDAGLAPLPQRVGRFGEQRGQIFTRFESSRMCKTEPGV